VSSGSASGVRRQVAARRLRQRIGEHNGLVNTMNRGIGLAAVLSAPTDRALSLMDRGRYGEDVVYSVCAQSNRLRRMRAAPYACRLDALW